MLELIFNIGLVGILFLDFVIGVIKFINLSIFTLIVIIVSLPFYFACMMYSFVLFAICEQVGGKKFDLSRRGVKSFEYYINYGNFISR